LVEERGTKMRAVASELAHVLVQDEDGDWGLLTVGVTEDGDVAVGRDATGTLEEVTHRACDDVPVVVGRRF